MKRPPKKKKEVKRNEVGRNKAESSSINGSIRRLAEHKTLVAVFLFLICFGVFALSLRNDFVWDDVIYLKNSPDYFRVSNINSGLFLGIKGHQGFSYYRPILFISFAIDHELWGLSPFGFHLSNTIFYSFSTVLFYLLVLFMLEEFKVDGKEVKAFLSSLFFAFYPTHVEAASWISGRMDLLCSLFFFLAFVFDILSRIFKSRDSILRYGVYGILILIYFYLRGRAILPQSPGGGVQQSTHNIYRVWEVLRILLCSYLFYIKKLLFPFDLNPFITAVPQGFYYLVSSILVILLLCVISFISIRRREYVTTFSISWIFITLGPPSLVAVIPVTATPLADRYLYIPSGGYCLLIGYLIIELEKRVEYKKLVYALGLALCLSYLFFTIRGQGIWKNDLVFWESVSKRSSDQFIPHIDYGAALREAGKTDEAIQEFLTAFRSEERRVG